MYLRNSGAREQQVVKISDWEVLRVPEVSDRYTEVACKRRLFGLPQDEGIPGKPHIRSTRKYRPNYENRDDYEGSWEEPQTYH